MKWDQNYANLPLLSDTVDSILGAFDTVLRGSLTPPKLDGCADLSDPPPLLTLACPVTAAPLPERPVPWCRWLCPLAQESICFRCCSLSACCLGR
jgi:hypothetical protein